MRKRKTQRERGAMPKIIVPVPNPRFVYIKVGINTNSFGIVNAQIHYSSELKGHCKLSENIKFHIKSGVKDG